MGLVKGRQQEAERVERLAVLGRDAGMGNKGDLQAI
jgi:hypothetical protein